MRLLRSIAERFETRHYAAVEKPATDAEFNERTRELSELGIRPIWYPHGEHGLLEPLLGYLASKSRHGMPSSIFRAAVPPREPPNNIPRPPNPTVGRSQEIRQIASMLSGVRLVTIFGGGGSGKSRLGMEVAHEVRLGFPDGVWYIDLADLSEK